MAWKIVDYNSKLSRLGAEYDGCPSACRGPNKDTLRGCPECEVTLLYREFEEELAGEMADLAEEKGLCVMGKGASYKWPWSFGKLLRDVNFIASVNARVAGNGYDLKWTTPVKNLVVIFRQEQNIQDKLDREDAKRRAERGRQRD